METFLEELDALHAQVSQEAALIVDGQNDLLGAFVSIESSNTVDRETGMAIINQVPSLESVTPNMFTMFPTKTNVNVAVEGFWEGLVSGIGRVFELIFTLMGKVLELMVMPFKWLLGSDDKKGATEKYKAKVDDLIEKVDGNEDKIQEVLKTTDLVKDVVDNTNFNEFEAKVILNPSLDLYNDIADFIIKAFDVIMPATNNFVMEYKKIKGGDEFGASIRKLELISNDTHDVLVELTKKLYKKNLSFLGDDIGNPSTIESVNDTFQRLGETIRTMEANEITKDILRKYYASNLGKVDKYLGNIKGDLDFSKSDNVLFKAKDNYTKELDKMSDILKVINKLDLSELGITGKDADKLRKVVNEYLSNVRATNTFIRLTLSISVKGRRALFKGIDLSRKCILKAYEDALPDLTVRR